MYDSCIVIPGIACVHEKVSRELAMCDLGNTSYFKDNYSSTSQKNKSSQKVPQYAQYVLTEVQRAHEARGVTEQLLCNLQIAACLL